MRFAVDAALAGLRLDHFLVRVLPGSSGPAARRLLLAGKVTLDGRRPSKGDRVAVGQMVEVDLEGADDEVAVRPDPSVELEILYIDVALLAVNKPAGIASHPLRPGELGTAANGIVARYPECTQAGGDPREAGLGHRLDRETSGVLLAARNRPAWERLRAALRDPGCEKTYLAEVWGEPPASGSFSGQIGRTGRRGGRVKIDKGRRPLPAHTDWEVLAPHAGSTLLRARLHAGRAHQVRAHLAAIGHAILGDALYGDDRSRALSDELGVTALRLHAESVRLPHPLTGEPLFVTAPPPTWAKMAP